MTLLEDIHDLENPRTAAAPLTMLKNGIHSFGKNSRNKSPDEDFLHSEERFLILQADDSLTCFVAVSSWDFSTVCKSSPADATTDGSSALVSTVAAVLVYFPFVFRFFHGGITAVCCM